MATSPESGGPGPLLRAAVTCCALVLSALLAGGCAGQGAAQSTEQDGFPKPELSQSNELFAKGSLAAVEIRGQKDVTVRETLESVYTGAGFKVAGRKGGFVSFDIPPSRKVLAAYGNWNGMEVRVRMKVEVIPQNGGVFLLVCHSFVVREPGSMSEDEQPLARRHVRDYEKLLYEVGNRLN